MKSLNFSFEFEGEDYFLFKLNCCNCNSLMHHLSRHIEDLKKYSPNATEQLTMTRKFCVSSVALAKDNGMVSKSQKISAIPELQRKHAALFCLVLDKSLGAWLKTWCIDMCHFHFSLSLHAPCAPDADAAAHCLCPSAGSVTMSKHVLANMFQILKKHIEISKTQTKMFQLPQPKVFREKHNKKINQTSPPRRPRLRKAKPFELDDLDEIQTSSIKKHPTNSLLRKLIGWVSPNGRFL